MKREPSIDSLLIQQFRKIVIAYSKATGLSKQETIELLLPLVLSGVERSLRDAVK